MPQRELLEKRRSGRVKQRSPEAFTPSYDIDDGLALNQLRLWAPNAAVRRKILVENPARLYDF